jgi:GNAT superfamily N-acetyltransferase
VQIRETTLDDVPQIYLIRQASQPWHVSTVETQRHWFESHPPEARMRRYCAIVDGRFAGYGNARLELYAEEAGLSHVHLEVHPELRGRGIATALYGKLEEHLRDISAVRVQTYLMDDPGSVSFAEKNGYTLGARIRFIAVDPRNLPPVPEIPGGVTVVTAAEGGPQAWYDVVDVAARDEPGDVPFVGLPYEHWLATQWPSLDKDISLIAFVDGKPAATTALNANYETRKVESAGTDALREYRGRGLVKLIKSLSLRAAAERGITAAYTANDETNAPMRAINKWLGYDFVGDTRSALKTL